MLHIDDSEQNARDFAVRLERFDAALRTLYGVGDDPDLLLRPVTVYVLRSGDFQAACRCYGAVGVSYARTAGSFILSLYDPKVDAKATVGALSSQTVLLHEYSHQFMATNFTGAYPYWFRKGSPNSTPMSRSRATDRCGWVIPPIIAEKRCLKAEASR